MKGDLSMLRNSLILGLVFIGFIFSGFFSVDQREIGVVNYSSTQAMQTYQSGLHWKIPLYGDLSYVFTNQRSSYIAMNQALTFESGAATSKVLVTWKVTQAESYLAYLNKNSTKLFDAELSQAILTKLTTLAAQSQDNLDFSHNVEQSKNWSLNNLGVKIINLQLISLNIVPTVLTVKPVVTALSPESSFILAQQIKNQANDSQAIKFAKARISDPKFFDYVLKVHNLEKNAQSKQDIPALSQLYN